MTSRRGHNGRPPLDPAAALNKRRPRSNARVEAAASGGEKAT